MTFDTADHARPELSAAAHREWDGHVESVLRGIAHSLNNRAAALSAVIELARDPDEDSAFSSILSTELERVSDLVAAIRSMVSTTDRVDAFAPADAAAEAMPILRLHAELRDRRITIEAGGAPPLRVPRWMFVRALVVLGATAARTVADAKVLVSAEAEWLVVRADDPSAPPVGPTRYVTELAHAMGGEPLRSGCGFRVPTLALLRRREGREG